MVDFLWDTNKEIENIRKHGIDFETASFIWEGPILEKLDDRYDYGEERFIVIGTVDGRVLVVVYTRRGDARRLISARMASRRERREYEEEIHRRSEAEPG
jgi:uncharacterized protein